MHILCTICSDIVNQAESIYVTKCGHLFHHHCLSQWIERSRTCPQCRCKVTERCMFRVFPTAAGGGAGGEDAGALQARLDDVMLQLRQQGTALTDAQARLQAAADTAATQQQLLKAHEKKLLSAESAVAALREQLQYVKVQNKETHRLKDENEQLKKSMQTLNALEKVLNATSSEVEQMLQGYTDVRTIATFATALKRALCEAEAAKSSWREQLSRLRTQLAQETSRSHDLLGQQATLREELSALRRTRENNERERDGDERERDGKRRRAAPAPPHVSEPPASPDTSIGSLARVAASAESPYLQLRASGLALGALQRRPLQPTNNLKPSELALLNSARAAVSAGAAAGAAAGAGARPAHSIFGGAGAGAARAGGCGAGGEYDGLGGHARADPSPAPRALPRPGVRHRLRRPASAAPGTADIASMFQQQGTSDRPRHS